MNIFVTSSCPKASAQALDDKRVIKMILETAQILSTVIREIDQEFANSNGLYKKTHTGHPCVKWAGQNKQNYQWLLQHMKALMEEYSFRFNKNHKSGLLFGALYDYCELMPEAPSLAPFVNCTDFKHINDVHDAYKRALIAKWKNDKLIPKWTKSKRPEWGLI